MAESVVIVLGERALPVQPLPLGKLRRLVPAFNRAARAFGLGAPDDSAFDDIFAILCEATGCPAAEIEAIPGGTWPQLMAAIDTVAIACGLKPQEKGEGAPDPGDALPGNPSPASTPGTLSTPA